MKTDKKRFILTVAITLFILTAVLATVLFSFSGGTVAAEAAEIKPGGNAQPAEKPKDKGKIIGMAVGIPVAALAVGGGVAAYFIMKKKKKGESEVKSKSE